jgi:hypothetical protein
MAKYPLYQTEMLTNPRLGIYTITIYYNDGTVETHEVHKGPILIPMVIL